MAAQSELYVNPAIAGDSGTGTVGDPYGDLEYCLEQEDWDNTNGIRVNIKAGTDEIIAAKLETAMADVAGDKDDAWVPIEAAPLTFQGYTAVAGDEPPFGSQGGIDGGAGNFGIMPDAVHDYVHFIDLHCHNTGTAAIFDLDNFCAIIRCELDNSTHAVSVGLDNGGLLLESYVHNLSGQVNLAVASAAFNRFENGANKFTIALSLPSLGWAYRNTFKLSDASDGILLSQDSNAVNNSIWSDAGTGQGVQGVAATIAGMVINNLTEGFSGAGGVGYDFSPAQVGLKYYGGNGAYDNATDYAAPSDYVIHLLGGAVSNEVLTASPFVDAANGDFRPVVTGSVRQGALPQAFLGGSANNVMKLWRGAVEPFGGGVKMIGGGLVR